MQMRGLNQTFYVEAVTKDAKVLVGEVLNG